MKQTKMSAAQITIWFTNARVKMRKAKKLQSNIAGKKNAKKQSDDFNQLEETFTLSMSFDDEKLKRSHTYSSIAVNQKRMVIAYSLLNISQIVCYKKKSKFNKNSLLFRLNLVIYCPYTPIIYQYPIVLMIVLLI